MKKIEVVFPNIDRKSNPELDQKLQELEKEMQKDFERYLKEEDEELKNDNI